MKTVYRNCFLLLAFVALLVMCYKFPEGHTIIAQKNKFWWLYLVAAVFSWLPVYWLNAKAFRLFVNLPLRYAQKINMRQALQLTVSGFAFSYITPFGAGGAPYRVMELAPRLGTTKALSAVTLYSMMHVFSHFFLWATAVLLFLLGYEAQHSTKSVAFCLAYLLCFVVAVYLFLRVYRCGLLQPLLRWAESMPFFGKKLAVFSSKQQDRLQEIDANLHELYLHKTLFLQGLLWEYFARVLNAFEFFFILKAMGYGQASFGDALLILAFSSFVGNVLFFFPMQMGAREGSFALIMPVLFGLSNVMGLYVGVFTRVREIFWVAIGAIWMKIGTGKSKKVSSL